MPDGQPTSSPLLPGGGGHVSNLVTRVLSGDAEPPIRPRTTSVYEPGQDLQPAAPSWLGEWGESPGSQPELPARVAAHVVGPPEPVGPARVPDAREVAQENDRGAPREGSALSTPGGQAPAPRARGERAAPGPEPTADPPPPAAHRSPAARRAAAPGQPAAPVPTVASAPVAEGGAPHAAVAAPAKGRTPDTRTLIGSSPPLQEGGLIAAPPASHPVRARVDGPPAAAFPAASRRPTERPAAQPEYVQVTIGRVEIRASRSPEQRPPTAAASGPARRPLLSLEDYLRGRSGGVSA